MEVAPQTDKRYIFYLCEAVLKLVPLVESDGGSKFFELTVDGAENADEALDIACGVIILKEIDLLDGVKVEEGGFEMRAVDAIEISKGVLWDVNPDLLWCNGLVGGHCSQLVSEWLTCK